MVELQRILLLLFPPTSAGKDRCCVQRKAQRKYSLAKRFQSLFLLRPSLIDGSHGKSSSTHEWSKKEKFKNLLVKTMKDPPQLRSLYLVPLCISVNISAALFILPLCEPFVCLVCTQKIHHCHLTVQGSEEEQHRKGPRRRRRSRWKKQVWIFDSDSCRKYTFPPKPLPGRCLFAGAPCGMQGNSDSSFIIYSPSSTYNCAIIDR